MTRYFLNGKEHSGLMHIVIRLGIVLDSIWQMLLAVALVLLDFVGVSTQIEARITYTYGGKDDAR